MTDEERRELCAELRDPSLHTVLQTCDKAADEIERLAKELEYTRMAWERLRDEAVNEIERLVAKLEAKPDTDYIADRRRW